MSDLKTSADANAKVLEAFVGLSTEKQDAVKKLIAESVDTSREPSTKPTTITLNVEHTGYSRNYHNSYRKSEQLDQDRYLEEQDNKEGLEKSKSSEYLFDKLVVGLAGLAIGAAVYKYSGNGRFPGLRA